MKEISKDDVLLMLKALEILIEDMENDISVGNEDFLQELIELYERLEKEKKEVVGLAFDCNNVNIIVKK